MHLIEKRAEVLHVILYHGVQSIFCLILLIVKKCNINLNKNKNDLDTTFNWYNKINKIVYWVLMCAIWNLSRNFEFYLEKKFESIKKWEKVNFECGGRNFSPQYFFAALSYTKISIVLSKLVMLSRSQIIIKNESFQNFLNSRRIQSQGVDKYWWN